MPDWGAADGFLSLIAPDADEFVFQTFSDDKSKVRIDTNYPGVKPGEVIPQNATKKTRRVDPLAKIFVGTLKAHKRIMGERNLERAGVFVTINETIGARTLDDFKRVRAVWAELDNGLPEKKWPLKPSIIVNTSPGKYHVYWLVDDEMALDVFRGIQSRLVKDWKGDHRAIDPVRVMRLPGSIHMKTEQPYLVTLDYPKGDEQAVVYLTAQLLKAFPPIERVRRDHAQSLRSSPGSCDPETVRSVLDAIAHQPNEHGVAYVEDYWTWLKVGMALKKEFGDAGLPLWLDWSAGLPEKFDEATAEYKWTTFDHERRGDEAVTLGSVFRWAKEAGWQHPGAYRSTGEVEPSDDRTASEFGLAVEKWDTESKSEFLSRMNREHALVSFSGSTRYLHERIGERGVKELVFMRPDDMKRYYANVSIALAKEKTIGGYEAWDRWKERRQFIGVGLFPQTDAPPGYLNLWQGFAVNAQEGDWSLLRLHLRNVVCGGDKRLFKWLMDWLAHLVQKPFEKPGTAVVLKSVEKGTGKSMVLEFLRRIFGGHAMSVSHAEHVVGKFNGHFLKNILLGVEEAFWAGNKAAEGVIKNLITEPSITIEQKGVDPISARNYTRLLITSNNHWTVPAGIDERRFFVLEVKNPRAKDRTYFDPIFAQMESGGVEAMLFDLLHREITCDLRNPPETEALREEREYSLDGVHKWLLGAARGGDRYMTSVRGPMWNCMKARAQASPAPSSERPR